MRRLSWRSYILVFFLINIALGVTEPLTKRSESFKLPASSMYPNVLLGDHLMADRMAYKHFAPKRGDIVIFRYPKDESLFYIKRIVGLPGDTVTISGPKVTISGAHVTYTQLPDDELNRFRKLASDMSLRNAENTSYLKETVDSASYVILRKNDPATGTQSYSVPPDSYFMLGDNRDFSNDSRFIGFIPGKDIVAKAKFLWLHFAKDEYTESYRLLTNRIGMSLK